MSRRKGRSRDERSAALATGEVVRENEAVSDARAEEARQVRAALAEYLSILQEWSLHDQQIQAGFDSTEDHPS